MRAVQIERFGAPEVLEVAEVSSPEPQGDEVLIEVEAAGVNRTDLLTRSGLYHRAGHPPLEGVMNFGSETIASWHDDSKTIPKRRFRRRLGLRSPLPGTRSRGRSSAQPRAARGLQRSEVDCENRLCLTLHATRPATVGSCIPADEEVALCWRLRGDGSRFARTVAAFGEPSARSDGGDTRLSHSTLHPGEWLSGRLRRSEAKEGLEGTRSGGHLRTLACLVCQPGQ